MRSRVRGGSPRGELGVARGKPSNLAASSPKTLRRSETAPTSTSILQALRATPQQREPCSWNAFGPMNDITRPSGTDRGGDPNAEDPSGRLASYLARTQTPLDLLALLTLWIVVVPQSDFGSKYHALPSP
jgi:hypothetical protein